MSDETAAPTPHFVDASTVCASFVNTLTHETMTKLQKLQTCKRAMNKHDVQVNGLFKAQRRQAVAWAG
jgi:hypothetical protein